MDIDPVTEAGRDVPGSLLGYNHHPGTLFDAFMQDLPKNISDKSENDGNGSDPGHLLNIQNFFLALSPITPLSEEDAASQARARETTIISLKAQLTGEGSVSQLRLLSQLTSLYMDRYRLTKDIADMQDGIEYGEAVASWTIGQDPDVFVTILNLSRMIEWRYWISHNERDLEESISVSSQANLLLPENDFGSSYCLAHVYHGYLLFRRYQKSLSREDLKGAISYTLKAVTTASKDYSVLALTSNTAMSFMAAFSAMLNGDFDGTAPSTNEPSAASLLDPLWRTCQTSHGEDGPKDSTSPTAPREAKRPSNLKPTVSEDSMTPAIGRTPPKHSSSPPSDMNSDEHKYLPIETPSSRPRVWDGNEPLSSQLMERLHPDPKIRLLRLLPGTESEPLRCSLEVAGPFKSDRGLSYEAISYAWGDGASTEVIWCDGKRKTITSSLAAALRRVRLLDRTRVLWADGICINQKDLDECAQQVRLMAAIYSQATQVLCWLGHDEGGHAAYTFGLAKRLWIKLKPYFHSCRREQIAQLVQASGIHLHTYQKFPPETPGEVADSIAWLVVFFLHFNALDHELYNGSNADHFVKLFGKPWFSRMWIRQEIGWAIKATVLCGSSEIDWRSLKLVHLWAPARASKQIPARSEWGHEMHMGSDNFSSTSKSFLQLLLSSRKFQCTKPEDRIFALLAHPSAYREASSIEGFKDHISEVLESKNQGDDDDVFAMKALEAWRGIHEDLWSDLSAYDPGVLRILQNLMPERLRDPDIKYKLDQLVDSQGPQDGEYSMPEDPAIREAMIMRILYAVNERRRLDEIEDPSMHAVHRADVRAIFSCATSTPVTKVDYSRSLRDIYLDVTIFIMQGPKPLLVLYAVQHDKLESSEPENSEDMYPSWVPRWDRPDIYYPLGLYSNKFDAWVTPESCETPPGGLEGTHLTVPAVPVGKITFAAEPFSSEWGDDIPWMMQFWKGIISHDTSSRQLTGIQKAKMYQRTLTMDNLIGDAKYLDGRSGHGHEDSWNDFAALWVDLHYRDRQARTAHEGISDPEIPFIPELLGAAEKGFPGDFMENAYMVCRNRRVFYTDRGYLGLGPKILQEGDMVFILPESVPFVLRPQGDHHLLVGDCYIDGAMYGEMMEPTNIQSIEIH